MENKRDLKGLLLVVFIVISLLLAGFIIYDKFLKEDGSCVTVPCNCEEKKEVILANKYVVEEDKSNYITFNTEKLTWDASRNHCEGFEEIHGTYYLKDGYVHLDSPVFSDDSSADRNDGVALKLIMNGNKVVQLHDDAEEGFHFAGCAPSDYYVIDK